MQKRIDLANQTFGRLTVISFFGSSSNGNALWLCQCQCGNKCIVGQECQWSGQKLYGSAECVWLSLKFTHYQIFYQRLILFNVP